MPSIKYRADERSIIVNKIQTGTVLEKNDDTTVIYERFPEYFSIARERSFQYIITKEPLAKAVLCRKRGVARYNNGSECRLSR